MKTTSNQFVDIYEKLFNLIFDTGINPESRLLATIKPFYQNKSNKNDPKNYRPITILSCLSKLFTAILNNRLNTYSDRFFLLLNENQCDFRKGYSTLDCIHSIHAFFEIIKMKKKKMYCPFVNFEKTFDKVWRVALWYKLLLNRINEKMYNFIVNMYYSIISCISYSDSKSDIFSSEVGVRDRPFNLKGGYGFLFRSESFFRTTRELEYLFLLSRKARNMYIYKQLKLVKICSTYMLFFSTMISTLYRVQHTHINLLHYNFHAISCLTHIY